MFHIGLNPYGFTHAVGLQAFGTERANPAGTGLRGFINIARGIDAQCLEFDGRWLAPLDDDALAALARELPAVPRLCSYWLQHTPDETLDEAIRATRAIGGTTIRMHLTPVLEGARAKQGPNWQKMVDHARTTLNREAPKAADAGLERGDREPSGSRERRAARVCRGGWPERWHRPRHRQSVCRRRGPGCVRCARGTARVARALERLRLAIHVAKGSVSFGVRLATDVCPCRRSPRHLVRKPRR